MEKGPVQDQGDYEDQFERPCLFYFLAANSAMDNNKKGHCQKGHLLSEADIVTRKLSDTVLGKRLPYIETLQLEIKEARICS